MDLKALLVEAKQKVPPVLQVLQTGDETMLDIGGELSHLNSDSLIMFFGFFLNIDCLVWYDWSQLHSLQSFPYIRFFFLSSGERGCTFCGGLGHRITDCPKLEAMQTKQVTNIGRKDYLAHSSMDF